jgi:DNA-binding transcriptional regulator YhcF (GntR family)
MEDYWATRTGRWRRAMQGRAGPSFAERLFDVIVADIRAGALPAGAVLPSAERVAAELMITAGDVHSAYTRLLAEDVIAERADGVLCIPAPDGRDASVGDATQIRFEAALLKAVREAAARGLSPADATGMFKAAILRLEPKSNRPAEPEDAQ